MAETRQYYENQSNNVFQRLIEGTHNQDIGSSEGFEGEENFQPHINRISEEIDMNINRGSNEPRWERVR